MDRLKLKNKIKQIIKEEELPGWTNLVKHQAAAYNQMTPEDKKEKDKATINNMKQQYLDSGKYATFFKQNPHLLEDEDLEEMTTTADVAGYSTPMAFSPKKKKKKLKEELEPKDIQQVRKVVKEIINNMFRDIWLKRNSWNKI